MQAIVVGTKGTIKLINFWTSIELIHADGRSEKFDLPSGSRNSFNFFNSANFAHEVKQNYWKSITIIQQIFRCDNISRFWVCEWVSLHKPNNRYIDKHWMYIEYTFNVHWICNGSGSAIIRLSNIWLSNIRLSNIRLSNIRLSSIKAKQHQAKQHQA